MADLNSDVSRENNVVVTRSSFDLGKIIMAVAFLILVLGLLKYIGALPF